MMTAPPAAPAPTSPSAAPGSPAAPSQSATPKPPPGPGTTGAYAIDPGAPVTALDSDHDGLTDGFEGMVSHTDPLDADTDHDGIGDAAEWAAGTPAGTIPGVGGVSGLGSFAQNVRAGVLATDHDGLSDDYESQVHTDPTQA